MEPGVVLPVSSLTWERQDPPAAISILQPTYRQALQNTARGTPDQSTATIVKRCEETFDRL
jgi:hypothetical protein